MDETDNHWDRRIETANNTVRDVTPGKHEMAG
jgi:hypothetical protein